MYLNLDFVLKVMNVSFSKKNIFRINWCSQVQIQKMILSASSNAKPKVVLLSQPAIHQVKCASNPKMTRVIDYIYYILNVRISFGVPIKILK